jgi:hypothetical protein
VPDFGQRIKSVCKDDQCIQDDQEVDEAGIQEKFFHRFVSRWKLQIYINANSFIALPAIVTSYLPPLI